MLDGFELNWIFIVICGKDGLIVFSIGNFMKIGTCIGCMNKHENMCFDLAWWILKH
jgi:hypothetical protein